MAVLEHDAVDPGGDHGSPPATTGPAHGAPARRGTARLLLIALSFVVLGASPPAAGAGAAHGEYEVKAAFLLNFARLVQWPSTAFRDPSEPIVLGIFGHDPFDGALEKLVEGKPVGDRVLRIRRISRARDVAACHMVFVPASETDFLHKILVAVRDASVLLVGESPGFASRGGTINFLKENGKIRFAVNRRAARSAHLKISSRMLRLAILVSNDHSAAAMAVYASRVAARISETGRDTCVRRGRISSRRHGSLLFPEGANVFKDALGRPPEYCLFLSAS